MNDIADYNRLGGIPPDPIDGESSISDIEEESPMTDAEKRIAWISDDWKSALEIDTSEEWKDVRSSLYGAVQMCNYASGLHVERRMLNDLQAIAFENLIDCIRRGKYEGASA